MRTLLLYTNTIHDAVGKEGENGCVNYAGKEYFMDHNNEKKNSLSFARGVDQGGEEKKK
jgi:hypothetical protein